MKNYFILPISISLFAFISQTFFIFKYGVNIPYWDQWHSEAELYKLYMENKIDIKYLVSPHNEHRILFTRLFNLFLFEVFNGWNPKNVMYIQSIIPSFIAFVFIYSNKLNLLNYKNYVYYLILISITIGLPYYWENSLWSFQNHFYFMLLFGVISHKLYLINNTKYIFFTVLLLNIFSLFTNASGIFSIITCLVLTFIKILKINKKDNFMYSLLIIQSMLIIIQIKYWIIIPYHQHLRAANIESFILALFQVISWPIYFIGNGFFIIWGGFFVSILYYLYSLIAKYKFKLKHNFNYIVNIILIMWIILQECAISYGRTNSNVLSSRFLLIYGLSLIIISDYILMVYKNKEKVIKFIKYLPFFYSILILFYFNHKSIDEIKDRSAVLNKSREGVIKFIKSNNENINLIDDIIYPNPSEVKNIIEDKLFFNKHLWIIND